jgi:hypothetical protein
MNRVLRISLLLGLFIPVWFFGLSQCGSGTTIANNPESPSNNNNFTVDTSQIEYSAVSGGETTVSIDSDAFTYPTGKDEDDLVVTIIVDGAVQSTLTSSDFSSNAPLLKSSNLKLASLAQASTQASQSYAVSGDLVSVDVTADDGDTVTTAFSVGSAAASLLVSGDVGDSAVTPDAVDSSAASSSDTSAIEDGTSEFENRDLSGAESEFCDRYEAGSTNSQVAFGCYLAKLLRLLEETESDTLLASFGESTLNVETLILDGIFDDFDGNGFDDFIYTSYGDLPFNTDIFSERGLRGSLASLVQLLSDNSVSESSFRSQLVDEVQHFEYMEALLTIVLSDSAFTYEIPRELFYTAGDLDTSYNDARLFMAKTKLAIVGLNILGAYDFGVDPDDVTDGTSEPDFTYEALVEDLNGSGETVGSVTVDSTAFLTMDDEDLITGSRQRCEDGIDFLEEFLEEVNGGESSDLFDDSLDIVDTDDAEDLFEELQTSIGSSGETDLDSYTSSVSVDLDAFFDDPPHAGDVSGSDPFDYDSGDDDIDIVESYFEELLDGIATF